MGNHSHKSPKKDHPWRQDMATLFIQTPRDLCDFYEYKTGLCEIHRKDISIFYAQVQKSRRVQ